MWTDSRELREKVVRALAKVGLVWALAVLGALFIAMGSQGNESDGGYSLDAAGSARPATSFSMEPDQAPRTAGLALALAMLAGGIGVLAVGAAREQRRPERYVARAPDDLMDLPLALGLGFAGSGLA
jgi:hypothetical protein